MGAAGSEGPGDAAPVVLIVEDDERNAKLVRHLLTYRGLQILEARTAAEGIELARAHLPDVVLMDLRLPDMGGREATRILREDPATASLSVVAVTASAMRGDREALLAEGFDGYFAKPIEAHDFVDDLLALLAAAPPQRARNPDSAG